MTIMTARLSSRALKRSYCTYKNALTSQQIRSTFLDYFVEEKGHTFIKSSPVASYFDPTIPFINSGMCQFKRVFTGDEEIAFDKVANTQKCIRVAGRHEDLNSVNVDSCHHIFFEMLGNYSFGGYNKKEACTMAWQLLTSAPYNISPNRLFVTYFGGDESLKLPADDEVREIWLELGIPPNRILPFGMQENFWQMSSTGPCGTCTEIHVALDESVCSRSDLVNRNNPLIVELWNIVFMKFNKTKNSLNYLPKEYIDTGMGLERLAALLQRKTSSYDSDLFAPLLDTISKISRAPAYSGSFNSNNLDGYYRCLADFSRLITVAISDNIFPDQNPQLKRVLRKALYLIKYKFDVNEPAVLLNELSNRVAETYQDVFPEIADNLQKIKITVENEDRIVLHLTNENYQKWNHHVSKYPVLDAFSFIEYPHLAVAYNFILKETESLNKGDYVSGKIVHYLYDVYGLDKPVVEKLLNKLEFKINWNDVDSYRENVKLAKRKLLLNLSEVASRLEEAGIKTDKSPIYSFTKTDNTYNFPEVEANLVVIVKDNDIQSVSKFSDELASSYLAEVHFDEDDKIGLIFDKSNFFCGESGRLCDSGEITLLAGGQSIPFNVVKVKKIKDNIVHFVEPRSKGNKITLKSGADAVLKINAANRMTLLQQYTATHLLLRVIEDLYPLVYYKSSFMHTGHVKIRARALGKKFDFVEDKRFMEERMTKYITDGLSIERTVVPTGREVFSSPHLRLSPGICYPPSNLQAINFVDNNGNIVTSDFCDGIHLLNIKDVERFEILTLKYSESSDMTITCRMGNHVGSVSKEEQLLEKDSKTFEDRAKIFLNSDDITVGEMIDFNDELSRYLYTLSDKISTKGHPQTDRVKNCLKVLNALQQNISRRLQKFSRDSVIRELASRMKKMGADRKFAVYFCFLDIPWFLHESFNVDIVYRNEFPTTMFHFSNVKKRLTAVSYVPKSFVKDNFNADVWLRSVGATFGFEVGEEEDMTNYCFMTQRVKEYEIHPLVDPLMQTSADLVRKFVE